MKELPNPTFPISQIALPRGSLHQSPQNQISAGGTNDSKSPVKVSWAKHQDEVREAQKLRYQVFVNEMGARLPVTMAGHDIDLFDDYCEHLLVRDGVSNAVNVSDFCVVYVPTNHAVIPKFSSFIRYSHFKVRNEVDCFLNLQLEISRQ